MSIDTDIFTEEKYDPNGEPNVKLEKNMFDFSVLCDHPSVELLRAKELEKYDRRYYTDHYWREDLPGATGNRGLTYDDPDHRLRFAFVYESVIAQENAKRLLDVGCGTGLLIQEAIAHGIDASGVDISTVAKDFFMERTPRDWWNRFSVASMASLPFPTESFDLCVCMDVLEHLPVFDVFMAVSELCRVCSDRIVCSINVDNPYEYHPTILSRESWVAIFESTGLVTLDARKTEELNGRVKLKYSEYDLFCFRRK
jgi:2-polyprenyl-3-methyl-5-hydroxy-6-metoxy-1,4-benzoquinol methylase